MQSPIVHTSFFKPFVKYSYLLIIFHIIEWNCHLYKKNVISIREFTFRLIQCLIKINNRFKKHIQNRIRYYIYPPGILKYTIHALYDNLCTLKKTNQNEYGFEYDVLVFILFKCVEELFTNLDILKRNNNFKYLQPKEGKVFEKLLIKKYNNKLNVFCDWIEKVWIRFLKFTPINNNMFIQIQCIMKMNQLSNVKCACCNALYISHKYGNYGKSIYLKMKSYNFVDIIECELNELKIKSMVIWYQNRENYIINKWFKCRKCRVTNYCTRKCQKIHWNKIHRFECESVTCDLNYILKNK